jgi:chromosome partitioning protein
MITKEDVYAFLDKNPAIKISVIEKEAGIPVGTIKKTKDGLRELNSKHLNSLYPVLSKYGFREGLYDQARVISVVNHKGGVAKTTTTINLGKALAMLGKKVLVIDMDSQGNLSQIMGLDEPEAQVVHALLKNEPLPIVVIDDNLHLSPSDLDLAYADLELVQMMGGYNQLKNAIHPIRKDYDYIFIDCPPALNIFTNSALVASNSCLITLQPEVSAIKGLNNLFERISQVQQQINYELQVEGVLFTLVDKRLKLHQDMMNNIKEELASFYLFDTYIRLNVALKESQLAQQSIFEYDKTSNGAKDYMSLAEEIIRHNGNG